MGHSVADVTNLAGSVPGTKWKRYAFLLLRQLKTSLLVTLQYRLDFFLEALLSVIWVGATLLPVVVIYSDRGVMAGWTYPETLLVVAWFTLLNAILDGAINPSLLAVVEHIRKGTLDFVLLKPVDSQFLVSTQRFIWMELCYGLSAFGIMGYAFHRLGRVPNMLSIFYALTLTLSSILLLYSIWIVIASAAFYVIKIDNLNYLIKAVFDAGRWPVNIFRGVMRVVMTWVIPIGLMTTFPAQAILGRLSGSLWLASVVASVIFAGLARRVWMRALRRYTSASS